MKIILQKDILLTALKKTIPAIGSRALIPILNNVLVKAENDKLIIIASDTEITLINEIPIIIEEPGAFTVPGKLFDNVINDLPEQEIIINTNEDNSQIEIKSGNAFCKLSCIDPSEFPFEDKFSENWGLTINTQIFNESLSKVAYSRSTDEARKVLTGILLSIRNNVVSFAATDSRRLSLYEFPINSENHIPDGDILLPPKAANEIIKVFNNNEDFEILISENNIIFKNQTSSLISKMIDGTYPNFRQVIPSKFSHEVSIPREKFMSILSRVFIILRGTTNPVDLAISNDMIRVTGTTQESTLSDFINVENNVEDILISFNPEYLITPLKYLKCENLVLKYNDEFSPIALTGDEGFIYIIMPMHK